MYYIYRITNKVNGKTYVGQHKYKKLDDSYMGSGKLIKRAIKKYGIENFEKEILYSRIQYKATADDMERFAIAKERALGKAEYNITDGGEGFRGVHHSDETKRKISEAKKGTPGYWRGKHFSDTHVNKLSETKKGKPSNNKGKSMSEEQKKKISESKRGKHRSEETKRKISETLKGKPKNRQAKHWKLVDGKRVWY